MVNNKIVETVRSLAAVFSRIFAHAARDNDLNPIFILYIFIVLLFLCVAWCILFSFNRFEKVGYQEKFIEYIFIFLYLNTLIAVENLLVTPAVHMSETDGKRR